MTKLVDVWIFDWDKYSPDDLVQKDDSFQLGPALLPATSENRPRYHLRCSRSAASAAIKIEDHAERSGGQQHCQRCAHCASLDRLTMDEANQRTASSTSRSSNCPRSSMPM